MRTTVLALTILLVAAVSVSEAFAQAPALRDASYDLEPNVVVADVRGTIKRKAVILPKPIYPMEARHLAADGDVRVDVVVDAEGSVISAKAVSGESVLFYVCEAAAKRTKFRRIDGAAPDYTETGNLVYGFSLAKISWLRAGFELGLVQIETSNDIVNLRHLNRLLNANWTPERDATGKLIAIYDTLRGVRLKPPELVAAENSSDGRSKSSAAAWKLPAVPALDSRARRNASALANELISAIRTRLVGESQQDWAFRTGVSLASVMHETGNPDSRKIAARTLRNLAQSAPSGTGAQKIAALNQLADVFASDDFERTRFDSVRSALAVLLGSGDD